MSNIKNPISFRTVFALYGDKGNDLTLLSNRQLIMRWIEENGVVFHEKKGKPPKQLVSYNQLCRLFEKYNTITLLVIRTGEDPERYTLQRAPIISK